MSDTIDRQAAIDALDVLCQEHRYKIPGKGETYSQYNEAWQDALDRAEGAIFNLPSAQPETGRWISADAMFRGVPFYCSECGENTRDTVMGKPRWNFCPNCGADMREDGENSEERTMRLINGDALRRKVKRESNPYGKPSIDFESGKRVIELIDSQPTIQPEPHWIPVTERLPNKEEKSYWVCLEGGGQCQCRWTNDMYGLGANEWSKWGWHVMDKPQYSVIVAWMPLPTPYREE